MKSNIDQKLQDLQEACEMLRNDILLQNGVRLGGGCAVGWEKIILDELQKKVDRVHRLAQLAPLERKKFDLQKYFPTHNVTGNLKSRPYLCDVQFLKRTGKFLDMSKVILKEYRADHEKKLYGATIEKRIIASQDIPLDGSDMQALYEEPGHATLNMWHEITGISWFSTWGTVVGREYSYGLHGPTRLILQIHREWGGTWRVSEGWLNGENWGVGSAPCAVLANNMS